MTKQHDAARTYLKLGWSVIPIREKEKRPLIEWAEFQNRLPSQREADAWWTRWPNANVGIVTGGTSGLVVLDVDGEAGMASLVGRHLPPTVVARTGRGFHYLFNHPRRAVKNAVGLAPGLDIRGDGGYIVAPPSIHANGSAYEWAEGLTPKDLELADAPTWLFDTSTTVSSPIEKTRSPYSEILLGVSEGTRNAAAARLAGHLFKRGIPKDEVMGILRAWNQLNHPPLPISELMRVLESIGNKAGGLTAAPFCLPLSELLAAPETKPDWLVDSLIEKGGIGFIAGEPKLSKSWLALHLAISLATGSRFLDHFDVKEKRKVLYLQEEDSGALVKRRLLRLLRGCGIDKIEDDLFHVAIRSGFQIDVETWRSRLHAELETWRPEIIIIDVFNKFHTKEDNSQPEMTEVMGHIDSFRRLFGCAIMIVHHFKKSGGVGASGRGNQRLRGSSVLGGSSENSLYLSAGPSGLYRVEPESKSTQVDPFSYALEDIKENGEIVGNRLVYKGQATEQPRNEKMESLARAIGAAYQNGDTSRLSAKALAEATGMSENTVRSYCAALEGDGRVQTVDGKIGDKNHHVTYYAPVISSNEPP